MLYFVAVRAGVVRLGHVSAENMGLLPGGRVLPQAV